MKNKFEIPATTLLGHPRSLFYLFFAELWERFSFYGMRSLLVLYMTKQLLFSDTMSFGIYAAYMSLVYLTPLIGGMLAEKILGYRKAIMLGGILMALGHFLLVIELPLFFYGSLALIIVGNGFFKPNISSFVGTLYNKADIRRDSAFTIFYMGINVGSALAPLLCGWITLAYGAHYGFMLAGVGMIAGLLFFYKGVKANVFGNNGLIPNQNNFHKKNFGLQKGDVVTLLACLAVPLLALLVYLYQYQSSLIWIATILVIALLYYIYTTVSIIEKRRLSVIIYFTVLYTIFSAVFEQGGSSLTLFADRNVNLVGIDAAGTNSINGGFIILLAVPLSMLWTFLERRKKNLSSPVKFGIGLLLLGVGFIVFALSAYKVDSFAKTPMFFLVAGYFIQTIGELFLSPVGLSKMTELSPQKYVSFIFGIWFLGAFYGQFFAGKIADLTSVKPGETNVLSQGLSGNIVSSFTGLTPNTSDKMGPVFQQLYSYVSVYAISGVMAIGVGIIALLPSPLFKRRMEGIH